MNSSDVFSCRGIVLNACCLMNLYATGRVGEILQSLPVPVTIATYLYEREKLTIYSEAAHDDRPLSEPIDLLPLLHVGVLRVTTLSSSEEWASLCDFAAAFKVDGEAYTAALAVHRQWAVGVDDPATISLFRRYAHQIPLWSTPIFVQQWIEKLSPSPYEIAQVIRDMWRKACYLPPASHPCYAWWKEYVDW